MSGPISALDGFSTVPNDPDRDFLLRELQRAAETTGFSLHFPPLVQLQFPLSAMVLFGGHDHDIYPVGPRLDAYAARVSEQVRGSREQRRLKKVKMLKRDEVKNTFDLQIVHEW